MKSLATLLKVAQRRLDELGIEAARIAQDIAAVEGRMAALQFREQAEIAHAAADPTFGSMVPAYRHRVKLQLGEMRMQAAGKQKELDLVREKLSEAYVEKSKFEQLIEQGRLREEAERAAREQAQLDEIAINRAGGMDR